MGYNSSMSLVKMCVSNSMQLFLGILGDDRVVLNGLFSQQRVKAKEPVFLPENQGDRVYLLVDGRVRLAQLSPEGREVTLDFIEPGEIFGGVGGLGPHSVQAMALAVENSTLCSMGRDRFEAFISQHPQVVLAINRLLGWRLAKMQVRVQNLLFRDVRGRLLETLKEFARVYGEPVSGGIRLQMKLTHSDLASLIGSTRETVTQTLTQLRGEGLVAFDGKHPIVRAAAFAPGPIPKT